MPNIVKYEHHGKEVSVQERLKGKHGEHCLCWQNCRFFKPEDKSLNCRIASKLFQICVDENLVTPVWECPLYEKEKYITGAGN